MRRFCLITFFWGVMFLVVSPISHASEGGKSLTSIAEIDYANFQVVLPQENKARGVLVLCPGQNGDGAQFLQDAAWRYFANSHGLAIVVPHFVSQNDVLRSGGGYFDAKRGSGRLLLNALKEHGLSRLPLLMFGFSGGAHFAMSFSEMNSDLVRGFCAYSFGWFTPPTDQMIVPAVVACGQFDAARYGPSYGYFQQGRSKGLPWVWVSLKGQDHSTNNGIEEFARLFFSTLLSQPQSSSPLEVDNITRNPAIAPDKRLTSILPSAELLEPWRAIHHP